MKIPSVLPGLSALMMAVAACSTGPAGDTNGAAVFPLSMEQSAAGKWVIVDAQKTHLYEVFTYDNGPDYEAEGLIRVVKNGKIGYADAKTYAIVIEPQFDCAYPFENGKAKVSKNCQSSKDGEHSLWTSEAWEYVDRTGNVLLK
jgi:hypothetical protein